MEELQEAQNTVEALNARQDEQRRSSKDSFELSKRLVEMEAQSSELSNRLLQMERIHEEEIQQVEQKLQEEQQRVLSLA